MRVAAFLIACTVCGRAPAFTSRVSSCAAVCAVGEARARGRCVVGPWGQRSHTTAAAAGSASGLGPRSSIGAVVSRVCVFVFEFVERLNVWKPGEEAWVKSFDLVSTGDIVRPGSKSLTHG